MNSLSATDAFPDLAISIENLRKTFNGRDYVLNGISLSIPRGTLCAIIGFSGTGKSVILKHILGLHKPTSGRIIVLGKDLAQMDVDQLTVFRRHFGVLFQGAALFDDMTVLENVCFPLIEHQMELGEKKILEIARERLLSVGLQEKDFHKLPSEISGGMQKRTGLARALALDPEILFYDEPTTGLDPILTEMVDELIVKTHRRREGITSVMVSHDLNAAFRIADFVVMLHAGGVLLSGTPQVFFDSENELVRKFVSKGTRKP